MYYIFILLIILIFILYYIFNEKYNNYLFHKSKSFDAEREIINRCGINYAWKANPSKSFDSESQGVSMYGPVGGFIGKTMKFY